GDPLRVIDYDTETVRGGSNDQGHVSGFNYTPPPGFVGLDWFYYTISDRPEGHPTGLTDSCRVYIDVTAVEVTMGEFGNTTTLRHVPETILLSRTYTDPVVIAQTLSYNGPDTSVVRITDVQSDRFTFYVHEAPDRDGPHNYETVSYLVVEAGEWQISSGAVLRAGTLAMSNTVGGSVTDQWRSVSYRGFFESVPVVFSQVQTNNDPAWVKTRHLSTHTASFTAALERDEANASPHGTETVGWLAIETGSGFWDGHAYVASRAPNAVTDAWYPISFGATIGLPKFFAAMPTRDGANNAGLRYTNLGTTPVQVKVEEDTTLDAEVGHITEVVDYLVLSGSGTLLGFRQ
ncbi:MAG: hypothetical protein MI919_07285, partial [Holophagales bacterium]|nr:hypothetical protein [Holophagales bacterium]